MHTARASTVKRLAVWWMAALLATACTGGPSTATDQLSAVVEDLPEAPVFGIDYEALGAGLRSCFQPFPRFQVDVDLESETVALREPNGSLLALRTDSAVYVDGAAFSSGSLMGSWLRVPVGADDARSRAVASVIGADAAGFVLVPGLPPPPRAFAQAVLDAASSVRALGGRRYRLTIEGRRLSEAAPLDDDAVAGGAVVDLLFGDSGRLTQVVVRGDAGAEVEGLGAGWSAKYRERGGAGDGAAAPAMSVELSAVPIEQLRSADSGCEL